MSEPPGHPFEERWSFGGATPVETAAGVLHPAGLIAGPDHAVLDMSLVLPDEAREQFAAPARTPGARKAWASGTHAALTARVQAVIGEVTVIDGRGTSCTLRTGTMTGPSGRDRGVISMRLGLDPVPSRECGWVELRGRDGSTTRLTPSPRPAVLVSCVAPEPGSPAVRKLPDQAKRADGAPHHLDIATDLPRVGNTAVRVDSLICEPGSWRVYLRARPSWWAYSDDRRRKRAVMSVAAEDDLGGVYLTEFGGSTTHSDDEELTLRFLPRLDPLARALKLTFTAAGKQVVLEVRLQ